MPHTYDQDGKRRTITGSTSTKVADDSILANLRRRWPSELDGITDSQLLDEYDQFAASDWFGDNDARFLEWIGA